MSIGQAQAELGTLRKEIEDAINAYSKRTGLIVDLFVQHTDTTEFGHTRREVFHNVEATASIKDGDI